MSTDRPNGCGAAEWLSLAAAPTFVVMALFTDASGSGPLDVLCTAAGGSSLLGGMVPMYWLMGLFHTAPWLRLIARHVPFSWALTNGTKQEQ